MITTITIKQLCLQEENHQPEPPDKQKRIDWITQQIEAGLYGNVERAFGWVGTKQVDRLEALQLACEAIKFHRLRLAGNDLNGAIQRMFD